MRNQSGFTLLEVAIVLVIIGLLLGAVLKGQELIQSARVRHLASTRRTRSRPHTSVSGTATARIRVITTSPRGIFPTSPQLRMATVPAATARF